MKPKDPLGKVLYFLVSNTRKGDCPICKHEKPYHLGTCPVIWDVEVRLRLRDVKRLIKMERNSL